MTFDQCLAEVEADCAEGWVGTIVWLAKWMALDEEIYSRLHECREAIAHPFFPSFGSWIMMSSRNKREDRHGKSAGSGEESGKDAKAQGGRQKGSADSAAKSGWEEGRPDQKATSSGT
jgi:hypothetical protein